MWNRKCPPIQSPSSGEITTRKSKRRSGFSNFTETKDGIVRSNSSTSLIRSLSRTGTRFEEEEEEGEEEEGEEEEAAVALASAEVEIEIAHTK